MNMRAVKSTFGRLFGGAPPDPPAVHANDRDAVTATLVYMIYFTMVAFMGFCLFVVLRFLAPKQPPQITLGCDPSRANQCREGEVCERGQCVAEEAPYCAESAACEGCVCPYPLSCQNGTCSSSSRGATRTTQCDAETALLVTELLEFEKKCIDRAGGARFSTCEAKDLNKFLLNTENFESLLKGLPHGVIVLFPDRKPDLTESGELDSSAATQWPDGPDGPTTKRYIDGMKEQAEAFRAAKHIFLIGRAGNVVTSMNSSYAKVRVNFTKDRILDGIAKDNLERAELGKKFVEFAIGGEKPMGLDFFATYNYPLITWNDESRRDLSSAIQKAQNNSKVSPTLRRDVEFMINRSVTAFAVPAECVQGK